MPTTSQATLPAITTNQATIADPTTLPTEAATPTSVLRRWFERSTTTTDINPPPSDVTPAPVFVHSTFSDFWNTTSGDYQLWPVDDRDDDDIESPHNPDEITDDDIGHPYVPDNFFDHETTPPPNMTG